MPHLADDDQDETLDREDSLLLLSKTVRCQQFFNQMFSRNVNQSNLKSDKVYIKKKKEVNSSCSRENETTQVYVFREWWRSILTQGAGK